MTLPIELSSFRTGMITDTLGRVFKRRRLLLLAAAGILMLVVYAVLSRIPDATQALHLYVCLYLSAFVLYIISIRSVLTGNIPGTLMIILIFSLMFRLVLLPVRPTVSTDFYRYLWDGKVAVSGINPYAYTPNSPHLKHLRDSNWRCVNYRGTNTPYPPVSQMIFSLSYRLFGGSIIPLKTIFVLCDLAIIALLILILHTLHIPRSHLILYAWNPLIVTEIAGAGHQDVLGVLLMTASFCLLIRQQAVISGGLMTASALIKPYPLLLIPILARKHWKVLSAVILVGTAFYLPYINAGTKLVAGSLDYTSKWRKNDGLFAIVDLALSPFTENHEYAAKIISIAIIALVVTVMSIRTCQNPETLLKRSFAILAAVLLLSPTLYPWYVLWTIPFLCIWPVPGWILFTGTVSISYLLPIYDQSPWIRAVEYLPVYALLGLSILRSKRRSQAPGRQIPNQPDPL